MLENPSSDSPAAAAASIVTVERYAPPNQRNRSRGRRKSGGDRLDWANNYVNDGDKNPFGATKSGPIADQGETGYNNGGNENLRAKIISLQGCCNSEASQLLNNRWAAAINAYNSLPEDSAEKPIMHTRQGASTWSRALLPHLLTQPSSRGASTGTQRFLERTSSGNAGPVN